MNNSSFWEAPTSNFDVVIIGAGFLGSWTAYELAKNQHLSIAVIERSSLSRGASTKNAGFACFGSATELLSDIQILGKEKAVEITEKRIQGIDKIRTILGDSSICYDACGGFEIFFENDQIPDNQQIENLNTLLQSQFDDIPFSFLTEEQISALGFSLNVKAIITNPYEGSINPVKTLESLHTLLKSKGVQIYFETEFASYNTENETITMISKGEQTFCKAKRVIYCTNAFTNHPDILPGRGQVFITTVIESLQLRGTFHYDEGYVYLRNVQSQEGNRILIGGGRNKDFATEQTTLFASNPKLLSYLEQILKTIFPQNTSFSIEKTWSGIMGFSTSKLPIVTELNEKEFMGFACNGMGVALTPIISEELASIVADSL